MLHECMKWLHGSRPRNILPWLQMFASCLERQKPVSRESLETLWMTSRSEVDSEATLFFPCSLIVMTKTPSGFLY
jgi:hypothetical protein